MLFHEKLRSVREEQKLTQHTVAKKLGITDRSYQNYEYGNREPNIETLIRLSYILDITLDELLCRSDFQYYSEESVDEH